MRYPPPPGREARLCEWFRTSYNKIKIRQPYFCFFFFYRDSALIVIVWDQALCKGSTIWLLREDMGDLLRGENDSKWSSEVQAIGDRIFFTDIQWCKNFSSIIPYKTYFFQSRKFFPWVFPCKIFFSRNQSGIPAASVIRESFACGIRKTTKFCFERRNPGLWNPEYNSRNLEFTHDWNREPKFHYQGIRNAVHGIWKLWRGIQKPRLLPLINTWGDTLEERSEPPHSTQHWRFIPLVSFFPRLIS